MNPSKLAIFFLLALVGLFSAMVHVGAVPRDDSDPQPSYYDDDVQSGPSPASYVVNLRGGPPSVHHMRQIDTDW